MKINEENMQRSPRLENKGVLRNACCQTNNAHHHHHHHQQQQQQQREQNGITINSSDQKDDPVTRIPSSLSVTAVDVVLACQSSSSPSHSVLTMTPGRTRNIDQDMEALRLSRQDNPFLQVLASRESLIESIEESESDDAILMSQEYGETDPLTIVQVHEHLVRSPPPASWPRSPIFQFSQQNINNNSSSRSETNSVKSYKNSPKSTPRRYEDLEKGEIDGKDRHSHTFSLLNPTPIRSLSEVRRFHRSAEDSVQLMSSE